MPEVCLVIPCYNEAARLPGETILAFVEAKRDCSVCFVNDGSVDGTRRVLETLCARAPDKLFLLDLKQNGGKAEAVRLGVLHAAAMSRFDAIGYWDADLSTPLNQLEPMRRALDDCPECVLAIGSRLRRLGSSIDRSRTRHVLGRVFATAASLILDLPVYDSQCGAKLFRASTSALLFTEAFSTNWLFDVELIARLRNHLGAGPVLHAIIEVPLTEWREVRGSKLGPGSMIAVPRDLLKIQRRYNRK